jgi:hypothetical protein
MATSTINTIIDRINTKFIPFYFNESFFLNKDKLNYFLNNFDNKYLNTIITEIYDIVMPIIYSYDSLDDETKKNNLNLNIQICLLLNKYIFFIYATYIIFNDIKSRKLSLYKKSFKFYIKSITKDFNYTILNIKKSSKEIPSKYLLSFSNKYVNNIDYNPDYIVPSNTKSIISSKENMLNFVKYYIYQINHKIYIKPNDKNNYITIPQYKNICWFVAIITGISYSDLSKKLLLKNTSSRINHKYQYFNDFVFYIIDTITANHRTYNEKIECDCEILKELKNKPTKIVSSLIITYTKNNENKCLESLLKIIELAINNNFAKKIKYYRNNIIKLYNYNYFLCKFISHIPITIFTEFLLLLNIKNIDDFNTNKKMLKKLLKIRIKQYYNNFKISTNYGSTSSEIDVISFFYELLNIKTLCCKCYKNGDIISTNYIKGDKSSPDVILLEMNERPNNNMKLLNININSNEIIFNKNKYKLDYIINSTNDILSCDDCGHTLSAIHYNKEKYFYDTSFNINLNKCKGNTKLQIQCSLVKQDWIEDIYNNVYYILKKCSYIKIDPSTIYEKENIIEAKEYYKFDSDIVYVYIKI